MGQSKTLRNVAVLAALALAGSWSQAAVILQYSFGQAGATSTHANVIGGLITNGGALSAMNVNAGDGYATAPVLHANPGGTVLDVVSTAFANNNYFYFTLAPDAGYEIDLDSLTFKVARGGSSSTRRTGVRTDLTGATDLSSGAVASIRPNWTDWPVDLTGQAALQNIGGPVTFQIAVATLNTGHSMEFDDIIVNGSVVAVPEPAVLMPAAVGLTGLALRRRRPGLLRERIHVRPAVDIRPGHPLPLGEAE